MAPTAIAWSPTEVSPAGTCQGMPPAKALLSAPAAATCASAQSSTSGTFPAAPRDNKAVSCRSHNVSDTISCCLISIHWPRFAAAIKLLAVELFQEAGVCACNTCLHLAGNAGTPLQACQEARLSNKGPCGYSLPETSERPPPHHLHAVNGHVIHVAVASVGAAQLPETSWLY